MRAGQVLVLPGRQHPHARGGRPRLPGLCPSGRRGATRGPCPRSAATPCRGLLGGRHGWHGWHPVAHGSACCGPAGGGAEEGCRRRRAPTRDPCVAGLGANSGPLGTSAARRLWGAGTNCLADGLAQGSSGVGRVACSLRRVVRLRRRSHSACASASCPAARGTRRIAALFGRRDIGRRCGYSASIRGQRGASHRFSCR